MITYFTKQYQAAPAIKGVHQHLPATIVTTRGNTARAMHRLIPDAIIVKYTEKLGRFSKGYQQLANSSVIVTVAPHQSLLQQFAGNKVMIFTGTSPALTIKHIRDHHAHFNLLCAIGPRMVRVIERSETKVNYLQAGYFPFLSFPEKSSAASQAFLLALGLNPGYQTIAYLPRGEPTGSLDVMLPLLCHALKDAPYNLIVRPHPSQSVKMHIRDQMKFFQLRRRLRAYPNVFLDLNHVTLSHLLASADLVISDANSPAEEALYYDVPQLLVETPRLSRSLLSGRMRDYGASEQDIELAMRVYDNGPILSPEADVLSLIEHALQSCDTYAQARRENFAFVFGAPGHAQQLKAIKTIHACV